MTFLSDRARQLLDRPPLAPYVRAHFERTGASYDPERRPDGYIGLCVAENRLMWPELSARLARGPEAPHRVLGYDQMTGARPFREALAGFLGPRVFGRPVSPDHLQALAGAGTILELLFYALGDPGDAVLIPTPSYAGFWLDLETRDALTVVPVHTRSEDGFRLTETDLDRAFAAAPAPVRALLFTTPDNPLGRVHTAEEATAVLRWAERRQVHVVFDEVYALSTFGETPFTSAASVAPALGDQVHVVWAFSKDFGASGLRCGVLLSENEAVRRVVDTMAYWGACSGHTQFLLQTVISDERWVDEYLALQRVRLAETYERVTERLAAHGVPFLPAEGGIFVLLDLRAHLASPTMEAEEQLWRRLLDEAQVNLTPGAACRIAEPGFFRLCWAAVSVEAVVAGVDRLAVALAKRIAR